MKSTILYVLMTVTLGSIGVAGGVAQPQRPASPVPERENTIRPLTAVAGRYEPERAYTERRWIGLRSKGIDHCPKVAGWVSETLLDQVLRRAGENEGPQEQIGPSYRKTRLAEGSLVHKLELERYCIYTPQQGPWVDFQRPASLVAASKDRLAISTTSAGGIPSDALGKKIWPVLAQHFRGQTGQEISGQESSLLLLKGQPDVRLTFIDSQPDGEKYFPKPLESDSQHGFTLVRLAQDMLCPSPGPCAVEIATRRALSFQDFDSQAPLPPKEIANDQSGHVGLVSGLATAIFAEVLHWRQYEPDKKLILNLSLGWDGEGFRDLDARRVSQLEPSVRAVYNALRFARKSGALVIAAAGNQRGGGDTRWPLLPAAWELRRPNWFRWAFFGRKPVYAVGGVDWQGLPLPNSRDGGRPRRVAYADHSVTFAETAEDPTPIYTGTSVSAAVASSIAAAVWHLRPDLGPAQVMRLIVRSGDELDARADFYAWKKPGLLSKLMDAPHTRRLSLCPAVARACGPDGSRCPALASAPACPQWASKPPELWSPIQELLPGDVVQASSYLASKDLKGLVDVASQRWVIPQPEYDPCPGCTLVPKEPPTNQYTTSTGPRYYTLVLEIGSKWADKNPDLQINSATLDVVRFVGGVATSPPMSYPLALPSLVPGPIHKVSDLGDGLSFLDCTAQIAFEVQKKTGGSTWTILNPVTIYP